MAKNVFGPVNNSGSTLRTQVEELQKQMQSFQKSFDFYRKLTDLIMMDAIDKYQYAKLDRMLVSGDAETMHMAQQIIVTQHTRRTQDLVAEKPIELEFGVSSVGNDERGTD